MRDLKEIAKKIVATEDRVTNNPKRLRVLEFMRDLLEEEPDLNLTELAEEAAYEFNLDSELDNETSWLWDAAAMADYRLDKSGGRSRISGYEGVVKVEYGYDDNLVGPSGYEGGWYVAVYNAAGDIIGDSIDSDFPVDTSKFGDFDEKDLVDALEAEFNVSVQQSLD